MVKKIKIDYLDYGLILSLALSLITFIVSVIDPNLNLRLILNSVYFLLINISILGGLCILLNNFSIFRKSFFKTIFIFLTCIYAFFYVSSSISFISTSQVMSYQSILFYLKINTKFILVLTIFGSLLLISLMAFIVNTFIEFKQTETSKKTSVQKIWVLSVIMLFVYLALIFPYIDVENSIVRNYQKGNKIIFKPDINKGELLINMNQTSENPNVIFILLESVTAEHVSSYGYPRNVTPTIDSLAKKGIFFKNAYALATHSDYAQPGYLSSNYILENNYRNLFLEQKNQNAVWQIFKEKGYDTYYFSSQNDEWAGMKNYFNYSSLDVYWYSLTDLKTDYGKGLGKKDYDGNTVSLALEQLNKSLENSTNPFFLYLNLQATHNPLEYPEEFKFYTLEENSQISSGSIEITPYVNKYDDALRYVDFQISRVLNYLENRNISNNTVIILSSDHGHDVYKLHGSKGHGLSIYDDEIRIPLIMFFPNQDNITINSRVSHVDVLPSVLSFLGFDKKQGFRGSEFRENRPIFFFTQSHMYLIGMIQNNLKVIIDMNKNLVEIYDLKKDPYELNNLIYTNYYDKEILTLLMWHNCQLNYFSSDEKDIRLEEYCNVFYN